MPRHSHFSPPCSHTVVARFSKSWGRSPVGAGRVSASYSWAKVTGGPWVLSLHGLVTIGSQAWSQPGRIQGLVWLDPLSQGPCSWGQCPRHIVSTVQDSAGLQSQTHCVHRLKKGVHCPSVPDTLVEPVPDTLIERLSQTPESYQGLGPALQLGQGLVRSRDISEKDDKVDRGRGSLKAFLDWLTQKSTLCFPVVNKSPPQKLSNAVTFHIFFLFVTSLLLFALLFGCYLYFLSNYTLSVHPSISSTLNFVLFQTV